MKKYKTYAWVKPANAEDEALNDFIEPLKLKGKMDYLHIRKFAWLYAESVLKESNE